MKYQLSSAQLLVKELISAPFRTQQLYSGFRSFLKKRGFSHLGEGSFRQVYHRNKIVIKIPTRKDGILDNLMEAKAWAKYKNKPTNQGIFLAPCRLLSNLSLMMFKIYYDIKPASAKPAWTELVDNRQIGVYHNRWVAYDYALNLTERLTWERDLGIQSSYFQDEWLPYMPELAQEEEDYAYSEDLSHSYG